jgi:hypothetical protein
VIHAYVLYTLLNLRRLIRDEQALKIVLVISSKSDEFLEVRDCIMLLISTSMAEIVLILGKRNF